MKVTGARMRRMPLVIRLKDIATAKGYRNAKALAIETGLPLGVVYPLWNNTSKRFDRKTIEVLCEKLQVPAGMILEYQPDAKKEV